MDSIPTLIFYQIHFDPTHPTRPGIVPRGNSKLAFATLVGTRCLLRSSSFTKFNQTIQTKSAKPNLPNQTYKTKLTKPNQPNQTYQTKHTVPNIPNQTYQTKPTIEPLPNQTYQTKPTIPNLPKRTCQT